MSNSGRRQHILWYLNRVVREKPSVASTEVWVIQMSTLVPDLSDEERDFCTTYLRSFHGFGAFHIGQSVAHEYRSGCTCVSCQNTRLGKWRKGVK